MAAPLMSTLFPRCLAGKPLPIFVVNALRFYQRILPLSVSWQTFPEMDLVTLPVRGDLPPGTANCAGRPGLAPPLGCRLTTNLGSVPSRAG